MAASINNTDSTGYGERFAEVEYNLKQEREIQSARDKDPFYDNEMYE